MLLSAQALREVWGVTARGVVHLGANDAQEADIYAQQGWEPVLWVEADEEVVPRALDRLEDFPQQRIVLGCVSATSGTILKFHIAMNGGQSSSVRAPRDHLVSHPDVAFGATREITTVRLDELLDVNWTTTAAPELLAMDIQGSELDALRGAGRWLSDVKWIYTEINLRELYDGVALWPELHRALGNLGFSLWDYALNRGPGWGDALYGRRDLLTRRKVLAKRVVRMVRYPYRGVAGWVRDVIHLRTRIRRMSRAPKSPVQ